MKAAMNHPWAIFVLVGIAQFMVVLDTSITNVALPAIGRDLQFSNSGLEWVITSYALTFGGFLLFGGRAADLFGRRRMLLSGMIAFGVFSFLIGISTSAFMLIALRALQGVAAALMSPAALSIVLTTFGNGPDRNRALSYWTLIATGGAAAGLLLGGVLTQFASWQWNFFINVPIAAVVSYLIYRYVPAHEQEERSSQLDASGALLITSSLLTFVLAISQAPVWGWTALSTLGLMALAVLLLALFVRNEARVPHPLVPLKIFKVGNIVGANLIMASVYAGMLATFYISTLYAQEVLRFTPLQTGLSFITMPLILAIMATRMPRIVARVGYKAPLMLGTLLAASGMFWLSLAPVDGSYLISILPGFILAPLGIGMIFMPVIASATAGVPAHQSGLASGLVSTSQQMGGALGLAILSGVATSVTVGSTAVTRTAQLVDGFNAAMRVSVGFMLLAFVLSVLLIKVPKRSLSREQMAHMAAESAG